MILVDAPPVVSIRKVNLSIDTGIFPLSISHLPEVVEMIPAWNKLSIEVGCILYRLAESGKDIDLHVAKTSITL